MEMGYSMSYLILHMILPLFFQISPGTFIDNPSTVLGDGRLNCTQVVSVMPDDYIFSMYVKDISKITSDIQKTKLYQLTQHPKVKSTIDKAIASLDRKIYKAMDKFINFKTLIQVFDGGEVGFSIANGKQFPSILFVFQLKENKTLFKNIYDKIYNKYLMKDSYISKENFQNVTIITAKGTVYSPELQMCIDNNFFYLTFADSKSKYLKQILQNKKNGINALSNAGFADIVNKSASSDDLIFIDFDFKRFFHMLEDESKSSRYMRETIDLLKQVKITNIEHINYSLKVQNGSFVELTSCRLTKKDGIFNILNDFKYVNKEMLKLAPKDNDVVVSYSLSPMEMWQKIKYYYRTIDKDDYMDMLEEIREFNQKNNVNIENDVIASIGNSFIAYASFSNLYKDIPEFGFIIEINNHYKLRDVLVDVILEKNMKVNVSSEDFGKYNIYTLPLEDTPLNVAFTFTNRYLVFSSSIDGLKRTLNTLENTSQTLYKSNSAFRELVDYMPQDQYSLCFINTQSVYKYAHQMTKKYKKYMPYYIRRLTTLIKPEVMQYLTPITITSKENGGTLSKGILPVGLNATLLSTFTTYFGFYYFFLY